MSAVCKVYVEILSFLCSWYAGLFWFIHLILTAVCSEIILYRQRNPLKQKWFNDEWKGLLDGYYPLDREALNFKIP